MVAVKAERAGFFRRFVNIDEEIKRGQILGEILDPYEGKILSEVRSNVDGIVFFTASQPMILENATAFQVIKKLHV
jgi:predicted deacylase